MWQEAEQFVECEQASREALREAVGEAEFLRVVLPDGAQLVHAIPRGERFPINFGRDVAAAIAGTPDRWPASLATTGRKRCWPCSTFAHPFGLQGPKCTAHVLYSVYLGWLQGGLEAVRGVSSGGDRPHRALQGRLQGARHHAVKQDSRRTTSCSSIALHWAPADLWCLVQRCLNRPLGYRAAGLSIDMGLADGVQS